MTEEFGASAFKEKPDISMVFIRQLDRTNLAASLSHQEAVNQTLANLPTHWRQWVYDQEDKYKTIEATLMYKRFGGRRLGTKYAPLLKDSDIPVKRYEDGSVDWTDPNIVSPTLEEIIRVDYQKFNELLMDAAEKAGLTWNLELIEVDAGDTKEQEEHMKRLKTPFIPMLEAKEDEPDTEET